MSMWKIGIIGVLIVLVHLTGNSDGCLEWERRGLLEFKSFLKSNGSDANHLLPTWVDEKPDDHHHQQIQSECCDWERVTCDPTTGHVTELSLDNIKNLAYGDYNNIWIINASLFLPFEELRSLNLSYNLFSGWAHNEGFEKLSALRKLETLNLESNEFNDSILPSLSALRSLKMLDLRANKIGGLFPAHGLASFSHLEILDLNKNNFVGSIPSSIGALSSLQALSMAGNELNGSLPIQGLCKLKKLETLDLSNNLFDGGLPPCLSNLRSLKSFDLSFNQFTRNISPSLLSSLNSLEYIDISHNCFEGVFSFGSFANHSNLRVVKMISDNDKFEVETEDTNWIPRFQLKILILSNCKLNKLSGAIPKFLIHQNKLRFIDLSHNNLSAAFNLTRIWSLQLNNNQFTGPLTNVLSKLSKLHFLDISNNYMSGKITSSIGASDLAFMSTRISFTAEDATYQYGGKILDMKAQFGTFEASSYEGNPFLCGPPLEKNCAAIVDLPYLPTTTSSDETQRKWYDIDRVVFSASFVGTYITFLFGVAAILYINPYWRQRWFDLIEEGVYSSYYFVYDTLYKLLRFQPSA
ncbi:Receptor-like protein 14 [Camellia lanceoleosa]|uniref:Receptor-like protein 14 n=1 Tax=Camellia lanceoleosa TaxID=1840588 RepID=A0ACC0GDP3_9ERIC|nr:Receptor-like protein 14 [Camellia lanceoleosa]